MKKRSQKLVIAMLSLMLAITTIVGSTILFSYRAEAISDTSDGIYVTFGSQGNYGSVIDTTLGAIKAQTTYGESCIDMWNNAESTTNPSNSGFSATGTCSNHNRNHANNDTYVRINLGNYKYSPKANDIIHIKYRVDTFQVKSGSTAKTNCLIHYASDLTGTNGGVLGADPAFTTDGTKSTFATEIDTTPNATWRYYITTFGAYNKFKENSSAHLKSFQLQLLNNADMTNVKFYIAGVYIGPAKNSPYMANVTLKYYNGYAACASGTLTTAPVRKVLCGMPLETGCTNYGKNFGSTSTSSILLGKDEYPNGDSTQKQRYDHKGYNTAAGKDTANFNTATTIITADTTIYQAVEKQYYIDYTYLTAYPSTTKTGNAAWVKHGTTPTPPNISTTVTGTEANKQNGERKKFTSWSPAIGPVTAPTTFVAQYQQQYVVEMWLKDSNYQNIHNVEWYDQNATIGSQDSLIRKGALSEITINDGKLKYTSWRYFNTTDNTAYSSLDNMRQSKVTKHISIQLQYHANYRVRFFHRSAATSETAYTTSQLGGDYYVRLDSCITASMIGDPSSPTWNNADGHSVGRHFFLEKWVVGSSGTSQISETDLLNTKISAATDYYAVYQIQFAVRFYKESGGLIPYADYSSTKNQWIPKNSVASTNGVPGSNLCGSVPEKGFASWVSTGKHGVDYSGTPTADNIGAINPETYKVTGPLFLYPLFLDNKFIGATTNGLVVNRTITQLDASAHKYQVRVELYTYNKKITNAIDIYESFMGNFKCDKSPQIFFQAYLGNGKFDESVLNYDQAPGYTGPVFRTSNAGVYGYVYDKLNAKDVGRPVAYSNNSNLTAYTWVRARFFDPNFTTYDENGKKSQCTTADYTTRWQDAMVCREYDSGLTTTQGINMQKGFRIVMLYEISPKIDRSIGGNNFLLSHENYMKVVVGSTTYNFHSDAYKTTCIDSDTNKTKRTALDPNINIKIQYDFVVHDYYMDLKDYDNTQAGFESNARVLGYLSALRNTNAKNNELVYGRMFSHGNVNVYNDKKFNPNNLTMPNTDVDGTRNSRVNIYYTVTHQNGTVVYETQILGNKDITKADVVAHIKNAHDDVKVDFTKDHYVTVKARVEAITHDTDSFGTAADTNVWEKSANAYFFAPRFIVADYGRVVAVDLQNESLNKATFTETPSYVLRTTHGIGSTSAKIKLLVNGTEVSGTKGTETKTNGGGELYQQADAKTFALYSFNTSTYSNPSTDNSNRKFLEGAQVFSYTTDVINHLKYSEALTVQRNVYVIPANNVLYDHYFLDFTKGVNSNTTNAAKKWTNPKPVGSIIYNCTDDYGYSTYGDFDQHTDYGGNNSVAVASPDSNTRNVYGNFTFKGTGFEIISRTGNTGVLIVEVYKKGETTVTKRFLVDTYLNSTDTLYQVPIVQCTDLEYGEYNVEFRAYYHEIFDHAKSYKSVGFTLTEQEIRDALGLSADEPLEYTLSKSDYRGGMSTRAVGSYNVYVDAVRIYNPLGNVTRSTETIKKTYSDGTTENLNASYNATAQNIAYELYNLHGELGAQFINVNDLLLDMSNSEDWFHDVTGDDDTNDAPTSEIGGDVNGILYIATNNSSVGSADAQVGGLYIGMNGQISVESSEGKQYLVDASGARLKSNCHSKYITRSLVYNDKHKKNFWVYTCQCDKPHKMTRTQIQQTGITFYNSTYETIGPENEVYLMSYNGVALCLGKNIKSVQVGLRAANNNRIGVRAYYNNKYKTIVWDNGSHVAYHTNSGIYNCKTEMYLDVTNFLHKDADGTMYLLLGSSNTGQYGIVALDTLKVITTDGSKFEPKVNARTMQLAYEMMPIEDELPVDESVQMAHALTLESDITVKYIAKAEQLAQYDSFYMEVTTPVYEGNELVEERTVVLEPVAAGEYYYFYLEGVSAKQMNDTLTAKIYMVKDGETYVSRTNEYSVATYAYNMLAKEEASDALKTVCANLLRYGAEAQKYFGYRTDSLADEELGQNQREYLIDTESLTLVNNMAMHNDLENASVSFKSATLVLKNKVIVSYTLNLANYEGNIDDLAVRVSYVNAKGETIRAELTDLVLLDEAKGLYSVECDILSAKQMRTVLTAAIYEGETQISRSVDYSIETYAAKAQGELVPLCNAMIAYGDAANAFFAN